MFWKKKNKPEPDLFSYETVCRREFARVEPLPDRPVLVDLGGTEAEVLNVSAGGLACFCREVKPGEKRRIKFELPGQETVIETDFECLPTDDAAVCHGRFLDLPRRMEEALHLYVLQVQKERLRRENRAAPAPADKED